MKHTKILIVEDDTSFSQLISFQLSSNNYDDEYVQYTDSVAEAKEIATFFQPDVILLDLNITDSSGKETFERITSIFDSAAVIILSGFDDEELALQMVKDGAQDYILKSDINNKLLVKAIEYSKERFDLIEKLVSSRKRYKRLFDSSPIPMISLNHEDHQITMINDAFASLFEQESEQILNQTFQHFFGQPLEADFYSINAHRIERELIFVLPSGRKIHLDLVANKLHEDDTIVCMLIDRTAEIEFEEQKFKIIAGAQENEKKSIAMELHDGLAQNLVLLNLWFNSFDFNEDQTELKTDFAKILNNSILELKAISYSLLPPDLENGFIVAVENLINRVNKLNQVKLVASIQEGISEQHFERIDKFNLYRIVQEFINNSLKHSKANEIRLSINWTDEFCNAVVVMIKDDGVGFNMKEAKKGLGIQNIEYRMKMGKLDGYLESEVGQGTMLHVLLPDQVELISVN